MSVWPVRTFRIENHNNNKFYQVWKSKQIKTILEILVNKILEIYYLHDDVVILFNSFFSGNFQLKELPFTFSMSGQLGYLGCSVGPKLGIWGLLASTLC